MIGSVFGRPPGPRARTIAPALYFVLALLLMACARPDPAEPQFAAGGAGSAANPAFGGTPTLAGAATAVGGLPAPTPDPPRGGAAGVGYQNHVVSEGETLGTIARLYDSSVEELLDLNPLASPDHLFVGQILRVPGSSGLVTPSFKLIPDSELVYGPRARELDVAAFVARYGGSLLIYTQEVESTLLTGPAIVNLVAHRYSVNPRLLLAAIEHRTGAVTEERPIADHAFGYVRPGQAGLYEQLGWAANQFNLGYYGRAEGGLRTITLGDGARLAFAADINDGTAGVQNMLGAHEGSTLVGWQRDVGPDGFLATYNRLFGNPFTYAVEPLVPPDLTQPTLALPWPRGQTWYFTGGPHGGWAGGSAWAALDFVPNAPQRGCYQSDEWVTAMAPGVVTRSDFGAVVIDLDGDGNSGTGWAITYMHLETRDRIAAGRVVAAGDPVGHPSCEGGFSDGTHVHIARSYNGRWIAADGALPFAMAGWVSDGLGQEYDGLLVRGDSLKVACVCREERNAVPHD